jgi:hypothetical protein
LRKSEKSKISGYLAVGMEPSDFTLGLLEGERLYREYSWSQHVRRCFPGLKAK